MTLRRNIPQQIADELMYRNRHTCCICQTPRKHVQIHHIDSDPSNNTFFNLAVLSLDCHSLVTGDEGMGRKYSPGEVAKYKAQWEQHCAVLNEEEDDEEESDGAAEQPIDHHYEDTVVEADSHLRLSYSLSEDDTIKLWVHSDEPLTVLLMETEDYEPWNRGKEIEFQECHEDVYELNTTFAVDEEGEYLLIICNFGDEDANVQLDVSVWER